jgi:NADH-quinone oxidoreductase subunit M
MGDGFIGAHLLTLMTFVPTLGALLVLALPGTVRSAVRWISLGATAVPLVLACFLLAGFDRANNHPYMSEASFQFAEEAAWIPQYNIQYLMGVDGVSVTMVLLTALLSFLCVIASWNIEKGPKGYFSLFLFLETGMMGVFCALDFFLFYVFWEVMLLPMYFLIGIWGGPRREYAAIKFFLYTLFGSVLMLLVLLAAYWGSDVPGVGHTFDLRALADPANQVGLLKENPTVAQIFNVHFRMLLFLALFIGFAIKVPIFPFHTWLPDAHVEAPTAVSVILAGVLLKMGTYGLLRIAYPLLPDAAMGFSGWLALLGVVNILYGACCAMAQSDLKKLVAYSSISHMGFVCLGMAAFTPYAMHGAVLQMFNHGTITAMLFLLVGVVYDRAHHRDIDGFGGLGVRVPVYTGMTSLAFFASLGLPGLSGFIGEALVFLGAYQNPLMRTYAVVSVAGIVITAGYLLWALQRIFLGQLNEKYRDLPEINVRELCTLVPLAVIVVVLGIYPSPVLDLISASLGELISFVDPAAGLALR